MTTELIANLDEKGTTWTLRGPYYADEEANMRFLLAVAHGLTDGGWSVRVVRVAETREEVPL